MQYQSDRVSIIIISYNHEQFIEKAIESVLFQTYKDIELIIVDNNSSDNTREILNQYKDVYNIKVIYLENNTGITGGINEGLKYVSGEFVSFFASDDIMVSNRIELQVNALRKEPEAIACFGNMLRINKRLKISIEVKAHSIPLHTSHQLIHLYFQIHLTCLHLI